MKRKVLICLLCLLLCLGGCGEAFETESRLEEGVSDAVGRESTAEASPASSAEDSSSLEEASSEAESEEEMVSIEPMPLDAPRKTVVEIYSFESKNMVASFEIDDREFCNQLFLTFDRCFGEACEKYPASVAPDRDTVTDYCVAVYLYTYEDEEMEVVRSCIDISYPYGHTNDIYKFIRGEGDIFYDYIIRCGKPFIDIIDQQVKEYIPGE